MSKSTVSQIKVWHYTKQGNNYFNVHINALGVMLTISENKQPKSYQKIKEWYESEEPESNPILFSTDELTQ
ncbi:hypothetical protein EYB33_19800 [Lysinibacillus sphaericus]|uniref:hypothetical protein n=1 Tax=Lysinibacillus sphaericus TaxID=1421 RepID=UPI001E5B9E85|nr:hypothetical protein [Lysinibacillus sphaericus]UDK98375.1 hypothetical protein EYB33_19800 [Lysinibacillus sphaericus]